MNLLNRLATFLLGTPCEHGCGYRTRTRGHKSHVEFDHAGEPLDWEDELALAREFDRSCGYDLPREERSKAAYEHAEQDELGPIFGPAADRQAERLRAFLHDDRLLREWLGGRP